MNILLYSFYPIVILLIFTYFLGVNKHTRNIFVQNNRFLILSTVLIFFLGNILLFLYFRNERFIYYWDYATFWEQSLKLNLLIIENSSKAFVYLINSMNYQEYTALPALFISLPTTIIGQSFFAFVLSSFNFFVIPFYLILTLFELALIKKLEIEIPSNWLLTLLNFMFVPFYFTLFHGYIGIVGQVFIVSLFLLVLANDKIDLIEIIMINGLTFLLIFTRRWYLFWVVSFYVGYAFYKLIIKNRTMHQHLLSFLSLILSGLFMLILILLFFFPYFRNLFVSNLATLYASYKLPSLLDEFFRFKYFFGLFIVLIALYGVYLTILKKDRFTLFLLFVTSFTTFLFMTVQSFEFHHYNLMNFGIFIFFFIGLIQLFHLKKSIRIMLVVLYCVNAIYVFTPKNDLANVLFTSIVLKPKFRSDITEIQDLSNYVNNLTSENKYAYCAASSPFINDDLLRNAQLPWILNSVPNLEGSSNNDVRDGFPLSLFDVNYVLVTDPVQIHTSYIDKQYINQLINDSLLNKDIIRDNYQLVYENRISDVDIYIFERIENYNDVEKLYFYDKLKVMYPDKPHIYESIIN